MIFNLHHKITTGHARKLLDNWRKRPNKPPKEKDTEAVWFPKELFLTALANTDTGEEVSGLRIYMAKYEKDHDKFPKNKDYKDMHTLVVVQTKTVKGSDGEDIEEDILETPDAPPAYDTSDKNIAEYNDGQLCPPGKKLQGLWLR